MNETTILVIEDDKTIQNFMKISLKTRGDVYKRQAIRRAPPRTPFQAPGPVIPRSIKTIRYTRSSAWNWKEAT